MKPMTRILGIGLIFGVATIGWLVLGSTVNGRTDAQTRELGDDVTELWGRPITQQAPSFTLRWPSSAPARPIINAPGTGSGSGAGAGVGTGPGPGSGGPTGSGNPARPGTAPAAPYPYPYPGLVNPAAAANPAANPAHTAAANPAHTAAATTAAATAAGTHPAPPTAETSLPSTPPTTAPAPRSRANPAPTTNDTDACYPGGDHPAEERSSPGPVPPHVPPSRCPAG